MKKVILFMFVFTLIVGCDSPQRSRNPGQFLNADALNDPNNYSSPFPSGPIGTTTGTTGSGSPTTPTSPGFETCSLADKYQTVDIGWFGVCQSTQDETSFKFRPSLTSLDVRTCLIPTYKDGSGSSTYIGQPQCTLTTSNQVISGKLYKNRQGFSDHPLNGLIIMKEPLLPEYFACMHAYVSWPQNACAGGASPYCDYWIRNCPYGVRSNAACDTQGKNYMAQICSSFKSKYSNAYLDISTR